jgi:CRP-like cAMP-binding protein
MLAFALFGFVNAVSLPFSIKTLGLDTFEYGLIEGVGMVGFVLGSLVMASWADRLHEGQWIALSLIGMGLATAFYGASVSLWMALVGNLLLTFMNAPSYIGRQLLIQRTTPREMLGRVNSAFLVTRDVVFLLGMGAAGLADLFDVRLLIFVCALLLTGTGLLALRMPGLSQSRAEWRQALSMLRNAAAAPDLGLGRAAVPADIDRLIGHVPVLGGLSAEARRQLARDARVYEAPTGTAIVRHGDMGDAAYFVLAGRAVAGREEGGEYRSLEVLNEGAFFGEIAALTGVPRTADVVAEQPATLLQLPAATLRQLMNDPQIHREFMSHMTTRMLRMSMIDLPRFAGVDQESLRDLRTPEPQPAG